MGQASKTKIRRTKLLQRHHTGKLRPHHHTSYGSLLLILLVAFVPLLAISHRAYAQNDSYQGHAYAVSAVVPSGMPGAPTINNLSNGQIFTSNSPLTVKGNCPANTQVEIFKNQIMAGSTSCKAGAYSVAVDLFVGGNQLYAQAFNADQIGGPQSPSLTVTLLPPGVLFQGSTQYNSTGAAANQFYIAAERYIQGSGPSTEVKWEVVINGGVAPYSVLVGWGDGKTDTITETVAGKFTISHDYKQAAGSQNSYPITLKATDQAGDQSYLQLIAQVNNGKLSGLNIVLGNGYGSSPVLRAAWMLLAVAITAVVAFWIGEKRELHSLKSHAKI